MKEIRVKKTARDQLPHLESDGSVELSHNKMANWPEGEPGEQPWAGYRFKRENSDVRADQQSCQSCHKNSLTASAHLHTKRVTVDTMLREVRVTQQHRSPERKEGNTIFAIAWTSPVNPKKLPAFLRYFGAEICVVMLA
jgi:hypothetical protein